MSLDIDLINPITEETVYETNMTHNLSTMAAEANIYEALWQPKSLTAGDLIEQLEYGLADLKARPDYFSQFNAKNGWGTYAQFVPFVENYLQACKEYPEAIIYVSLWEPYN